MTDSEGRPAPSEAGGAALAHKATNRLIGRDAEIAVLEEALEDVARGGTELVTLIGRTGVGKTSLLSGFISGASPATVGTGVYTQVKAGPHSGLADGLSEIVRTILGKPQEVLDAWTENVSAIGPRIAGVAGLVPELEIAIGSLPESPPLDSAAARTRLSRAVAGLLEATAAVAGPVVLVLDDMQWADSTDIELLGSILAVRPSGVLLVCSFVSHQAEGLQELVDLTDVKVRLIDLQPLTREGLREWLSPVIGEDPPHDVVSMIEQRTEGNPLYLRELVRKAEADGALHLDMNSGRWRWDPQWLRDQPVTEGLAEFFANSLGDMPDDRAAVLAAVACIGGPFDLEDAVAASGAPRELVAETLWAGIEAGLLLGTVNSTQSVLDAESKYRFAHDRISEAAQALLTDDEQAVVHLRIGRALRDRGDGRIFEAVSHLAAGAALMTDPAERHEASGLAFQAGALARSRASFAAALANFETATRLADPKVLGPDRVALFRFHAAEAAWLVGDDRLDELITEAWESADDVIARARVAGLRMKIDLARHEDRRAIDLAVATLSELGVDLPVKPSRAKLAFSAVTTSMLLRGKADSDLESLEPATDRAVLAAAPILTELFSTSYTADPALFPFVVLKAVELTMKNGRLPLSPVAFAGYGLAQAALGRYDEALRFGDLAMRMVETPESLPYRPWVWFIQYNFLHHWRRPINEGIAPLQEAQAEAVQGGDPEYAGYLAAVEMGQRFNLGTPFETLNARGEELIATFPTQAKQIELCEAVRQLASNLAGLSPDPRVLAGSTSYDERVVVPQAEAQNDIVGLAVHASVKVGLAFFGADFESVPEAADRVDRYSDGLIATSVLPTVKLTAGLGRMRAEPTSKATRKSVSRSIRYYERLAAGAPANYLAGSLLLKGEWARVRGKHREAEQFLDEAVRVADDNQQPLAGGLARESAALLYAETGRQVPARAFATEAAQVWSRLGFQLRLDWLRAQYDWLDEGLVPDPVLTSRAGDGFESLVTSLLEDCAEIAPASRALLFLLPGDEPELRAVSDENGIEVMADTQGVVAEVPHASSLVRYAIRSLEPVVVRDASPTHSDPYVASGVARSLAVVPVVERGRVVAVLHLESGGQAGAFDEDMAGRLQARGSRTALAIENALLHSRLDRAERDQTTLEAAQARLVPTEFLRELGSEDLRALETGEIVERDMSVLFSDVWGYTAISESLSTAGVAELITGFLRAMEPSIVANHGFVHDTRGDEVLALFRGGSDDAVRAALGVVRAQRAHNDERAGRGQPPVRWGIGISHGPVFLGMVGGVNRMKAGVLGDTLNLASRIEGLTRRYQSDVLISEFALEGLADPSSYLVRRAERVRVVNKSQPVTVYEVFDADPPELVEAKQTGAEVLEEAFQLYDSMGFEGAARLFGEYLERVPGDRVAEIHLETARQFAANGVPAEWDGATTLTQK